MATPTASGSRTELTEGRNSSSHPPAPGRRHKNSPHEKQAQAISKLLAHPEKQVAIPSVSKEKALRPPREMMKNVTGSSAGAGSGEFHVYKQQRRREYERIQLMEEESKRLIEQQEFDRKRALLQQQDDIKTERNRAKREKKHLAALKAKSAAKHATEPPGYSANNGPEAKRQRLHNADVERVEFKPKHSDDEDEGENNFVR